MEPVVIRGTGMFPFGKHLDRSMKDMSRDAVHAALADAGADVGDIGAVFFANSLAGLITGQECIRGETVLYPLGFGTIPIHNVENACSSGGNALHLAWMACASGLFDTVLVLGTEKANHEDKAKTFAAYRAGTDVENPFATEAGAGQDRTPLVDRQALLAQELMREDGITREAFGRIAAKAYANAKLNPMAHKRQGFTLDDVLSARVVVDPITSLMSSPVSDGAAAAVVTRGAPRPGSRDIVIRGSRMASRPPKGAPSSALTATRSSTRQALAAAGLTVADIDVAEVHDASVAYEVIAWKETELCPPGQAQRWAMEGHTELGGPLPVNPSGGLIARGHALGASGIAQVHELVLQLRGEAGERQVDGVRTAMAQIGGGVIDWQTAVSTTHVLQRA